MAAKNKQQYIVPFLPDPAVYEEAVRLTIAGEPGRKSNQRRIVRRSNGTPMIIKSQKALDYEVSFLSQVPGEAKLFLGSAEEPLLLWAKIFYKSNRPDLSSELLMDQLQKAGVISNDRWIKSQMLFGGLDKENPRSEIVLYRLKK